MESKEKNIINSKSSTAQLSESISQIMLSKVFADLSGYMNGMNLFIAHFNCLPNRIFIRNINPEKTSKFFQEYYSGKINNTYYDKHFFTSNKKPEIHEIYYFLFDDLIIHLNDTTHVNLLFHKTEISKVEGIINVIKKFRLRKFKRESEIYLLTGRANGIRKQSFDITKPKLKIEDNYNDDFKHIHQTILKRLSQKNDKGLVLLHGKPGTGKTSYIRYLVTFLKKEVIFLPPDMTNAMTNPELLSVLTDNPNSIFIIEDAENIILSRDRSRNSSVSALLNISDGLLSDCLNIQIICSFNTDISKVDNALMRKGRLIAKYEFKELEVEKAQALSNKLGFKTIINSPMTLTDIYNQNEKDFQIEKQKNSIGFRAA